MNRLLTSLLFLFFLPSIHLALAAQEKKPNPLPNYPVTDGVSAPFAGFLNGKLIVAGGCNFPDVPAADGGKKVFHNTAYAINPADTAPVWHPVTSLPQPIAYGATVATRQGLVCIGGQNAQGTLTNVYLLSEKGQATALPPLPTPIDNGGATLIGHTVYVTGGNQPDRGKAMYALNMDAPTSWKRLKDYPGQQRVQPIVVSSADALFLIGGYAFDAATQTCTPATDMLKYDPATDQWASLDVLAPEQDGSPRCLAGGSGICKEGRLYLTGGVNLAIFQQAMEGKAPADYMRKAPEWYRFNDDLLVYDLRNRHWDIHPDIPGLARAGGILLEHEGNLYMICGEIKPGIRTPQVTVIPIPQS